MALPLEACLRGDTGPVEAGRENAWEEGTEKTCMRADYSGSRETINPRGNQLITLTKLIICKYQASCYSQVGPGLLGNWQVGQPAITINTRHRTQQ